MPKALKPLLTVAAAFCLLHNAYSQTDTSNNELNLGRVKLQKDFTQSITIKGEQLEKMPFTNLSEAINAWTYGYFVNQANVVYVIDGIVINDVNAYSVYDIKEVTLVQNALTQVNGANRQQLLAVVTTRNGGGGEQGITVAGQSFQVKTNWRNVYAFPVSSDKNYFHQYHLAARLNKKNIQMGVSANYLRDVDPELNIAGHTTHKPTNYDRFRLNGWITARLGNAHELSVKVNAAPQVADQEQTINASGASFYLKGHGTQMAFNPIISLRSKLSQGFTNEFTASYASLKRKGESENNSTQPTELRTEKVDVTYKTKQVLLMDQITYHASLDDNWSLEPSVNVMFRYLENDNKALVTMATNGSSITVNNFTYAQEGRAFLVTPSLNLYYKNIFNVQGGLLTNLSKTYGQKVKRLLPFASTSIDVLRLMQPANQTSLKLFASYAQNSNVGDNAIRMDEQPGGIAFSTPIVGGPVFTPGIPEGAYWTWQTGTRLGLWDNLVTLNYFYERRNFTSEIYLVTPTGYTVLYPDITSNTHHINLMVKVAQKNSFNWTTGINATSIRSESKEPFNFSIVNVVTGDFNSGRTTWTGGWVNRLSWKHFTAGLDLVYYFNPDQYPSMFSDSRVDAVSLQNVYIGYQFNLKGAKGLEVYADSRNLHQDKEFILTSPQQYYGLGFKATL
jgi:hypothetical protein